MAFKIHSPFLVVFAMLGVGVLVGAAKTAPTDNSDDIVTKLKKDLQAKTEECSAAKLKILQDKYDEWTKMAETTRKLVDQKTRQITSAQAGLTYTRKEKSAVRNEMDKLGETSRDRKQRDMLGLKLLALQEAEIEYLGAGANAQVALYDAEFKLAKLNKNIPELKKIIEELNDGNDKKTTINISVKEYVQKKALKKITDILG